jgi:hypothetical protein
MQREMFDSARVSDVKPMAGEVMLSIVGSVLFAELPDILDSYCTARFNFARRRYESREDAGVMICFLCTMTRSMRVPEGSFPRLVQALPDKVKRAYIIAGIWHADTESVIRKMVILTEYMCSQASFDAMRWFDLMKSKTREHHAAAPATGPALPALVSLTKVIFT